MKIGKTEEKEKIKNSKEDSVSKVIDKKTSTRVFVNILIAIVVMVYFCLLSVAYNNLKIQGIINVVKVATGVFLAITLLLMEIAFKKENTKLLVHSIEALAISIHSLTIIYVTRVNNFDFEKYILFSSIMFAIYFVLKTILINTKARKQYLKNLSDIPEIVKKDEPIVKEASKKGKKNKGIAQKEEIETIAEDNDEELIEKDNETLEEITEELFKDENNESEEQGKTKQNSKLEAIRARLRELQKQDENRKLEESKRTENKITEEPKEEKQDRQEQVEEKTEEKKKTPKNAKQPKNEKTTKKSTKSIVKTETNKKEKTKNQENTEKTDKEEKIESQPKKKRGRPKKEVKIDD